MRYLKVLTGVGVSIFAACKANAALIPCTNCEEINSINTTEVSASGMNQMSTKMDEAIKRSRELIQRVKV